MTKIIDSYAEHLNRRIDAIGPGMANSLDGIGSIEPAVAMKILDELVLFACQGTHVSAIVAGREALAKIPADWLAINLPKAVKARLNLDDEWEFRRWLELLKEVCPSMMAEYIKAGLSSPDFGAREAAQLYASGFHGPVEGLTDKDSDVQDR